MHYFKCYYFNIFLLICIYLIVVNLRVLTNLPLYWLDDKIINKNKKIMIYIGINYMKIV